MKNNIAVNKKVAELVKAGAISEGESIFTKNVWRSKGYKVNKDEIPITKIPLYIYAPHNVYDKSGKVVHKKMRFVLANFYTQSQVTELKKGA